MPTKYRVTTDQGVFDVTVDEGEPSQNLTQSDSGGIASLAAGKGIPAAADALMSFGTSPTAAKAGGTIGRIVGAVAPMVQGAMSHNLTGALTGAIEAPLASWSGGKVGYFGTKMLQDVARPASGLLEKAAPIGHILTRLSGAQGLGDLAQMADPKRTDIGFLGMGSPPGDLPATPAMTPEQQAIYDKSWQGKIGRLLGRMRQ